MKIKISADSIIDLTKELLVENDISIMPLFSILGEEEHLAGVTVQPEDLVEFYQNTKVLPKTACRSSQTYQEFFQELRKDYDAVIHFTISEHMSMSYQTAQEGAKPYKNVYVINSSNLSTGAGLLVMYACKLREQGKSAKEIVELVKSRRGAVQASFVVDNLEHLYKGGRCSALAYFGANMLNIKPCIEVHDGKMGVAHKYMGRFPRVIFKYIDDCLAKYNTPDKSICFVTHSPMTYDGLVDQVIDYVKAKGIFDQVIETNAGCTVTTHCGANTLGILYLNDGE